MLSINFWHLSLIEFSFQYKEIDFNALIADYKDIDNSENSMSIAASDRMEILKQEMAYTKGKFYY